MSFSGEYLHTVDEKGRVIMPLRFREALGNRCMLAKGMEDCLFVYPMEEWRKKEAQLETLSMFQRKNRDFKRRFFSGSFEAEPDKQGRINLSNELIAYAKLGKDVYITGAGDYIEIWDRGRWDEYRDQLNEEYEVLAEDLGL
ncbi:MAG: division/cell wall cluster transcriptional repressor MraZ [Peptococcaceae bacterium]|jgi:MraZ protein|nr:division/cell wall cluster transcriptional repressor MraZ [Peptococcaceae bacterium]